MLRMPCTHTINTQTQHPASSVHPRTHGAKSIHPNTLYTYQRIRTRIRLNCRKHSLHDSFFLSVRDSADRCGEKASFAWMRDTNACSYRCFYDSRSSAKAWKDTCEVRQRPDTVRGGVCVRWGSVRKVRVLVEMSISTLG